MRKGTDVPRKGALKNSKARQVDNTPVVLTPGTFYTSPGLGIGKRGVDLLKCYQGEYANDQRNGRGVYKYANGYATYEGEYKNGVKHGQGTLTFKDGSFYEGEFVDGEIQGRGTRRFNNGNRYVGDFEMGEMHGQGTLTFKNRDRYEGQMMRNKMHGEGILYKENGDVYRGEFHEHRISGQGTMSYANGDRYKGAWKDGKRCGKGMCKFANNNRYSGFWENDTFNGRGTLNIPKQGIWYDGQFVDGKPVQTPTKLNIFWFEGPPSTPMRNKKHGSKAPTAEEGMPLLLNTPGTPLPVSLHVAAQLLQPMTPSLPPQDIPLPAPPAAAAKASLASKKSGTFSLDLPAAAPEPPKPMITELPPRGMDWQTAEMEFGRAVTLTLHANPPAPAPPEQPLGVTLVTSVLSEVEEEEEQEEEGGRHRGRAGDTVVRLLLLPSIKLDTPLPLRRSPTQPQERISALEAKLHQGQYLFEGLVIGDAMDTERLYVPNGVGYLVISAHGLEPGFCKVQLLDIKNYKPPKPGR
mmetsp:Transcript_8737/g.23490  ORF Transcript_8737/g.23490 Transcript_8737/m.23490 type:complete len:522 (-) Transcript_8737:842-2407(-)